MTENILKFPKEKIVRNLENDSDIVKRIKKHSTISFANDVSMEIEAQILETFTEMGLEVTDPIFMRDFTVFSEILKAMTYRSLELDHPLHPFLDSNEILKNDTNRL